MATRVQLGRSGLMVSPVCFGSWQMSPGLWGDQPEEAFYAPVRRAFELGINFFDTAASYGHGVSEEVLGRALKPLPREEVVIATKVYHHFSPEHRFYPDLRREYILSSCDDSLRRLGVEYIDLYQLHAWDPMTPIEESTEALEQLKTQGKIRAYGASNFTVEQMRIARKCGDYATLQPEYSLIINKIEEDLLPYCDGEDIGVLVWGVIQRGILAGKFTGTETFTDARSWLRDFQPGCFKEMCDRAAKLKPIAERCGMSMTQLVLVATLMHTAIDVAIVGVKTTEQVVELAAAMEMSISRIDYADIRAALQPLWPGNGYPQV